MLQMFSYQIVHLQETPVVLLAQGEFVTNLVQRVGIPMQWAPNASSVNWEGIRPTKVNCRKMPVWHVVMASIPASMWHKRLAKLAPKDMHCKGTRNCLVVYVIHVL
jgi:hypothetical protein